MAEIGVVKGTVKLKTRLMDVIHPAKKGEKLFLGSTLKTEEQGRVVLAIRKLGTVILDQESRLIISPYTGNGAVLARGGLILNGPPSTRSRYARFLHTPAVAVLTPNNSQALVGVADGGRVQVAAMAGSVIYIDVEGHRHELSENKQITFTTDGEPGKEGLFVPGTPPHERHYRKWLKKAAPTPSDRKSSVDRMVLRAEKRANRLELDVDRLIELMDLNKKLAKERKQETDKVKASKPNPSNDQLKHLTVLLVEQAKEMADLKEKGLLQIQRIVALIELAESILPEDPHVEARTLSLKARLKLMKEKLPPLFE